jgi:RNA polymerase sigma-70 factor (ECF subfamily)
MALPPAYFGFESGRTAAAAEKSLFTTTHWSVVLAAGRPDSPEAQAALEKLCGAYWYPVYSYVRQEGYSPEDAQDLTQGFFSRVLEKNYFGQANRQKGKFRSFFLAALKHYLSNERDRSRRIKRGGRFEFISWDETEAEERYTREMAHELTPQKVFEQNWALTLLETVLDNLRAEYAALGKARTFDALQGCLSGEEDSAAVTAAAERLNLRRGAVRMAVLRLRRRYTQLLRFEIAQTVRTPEQIDDEIRHLFSAWN